MNPPPQSPRRPGWSAEAQIQEGKTDREIKKLEHRADKAADYTVAAIEFAAATVVEADLATLEAIEARLQAEEARASEKRPG